MNRKRLKDIAAYGLTAALVIGFFAATGYFQWWRCGELFPMRNSRAFSAADEKRDAADDNLRVAPSP